MRTFFVVLVFFNAFSVRLLAQAPPQSLLDGDLQKLGDAAVELNKLLALLGNKSFAQDEVGGLSAKARDLYRVLADIENRTGTSLAEMDRESFISGFNEAVKELEQVRLAGKQAYASARQSLHIISGEWQKEQCVAALESYELLGRQWGRLIIEEIQVRKNAFNLSDTNQMLTLASGPKAEVIIEAFLKLRKRRPSIELAGQYANYVPSIATPLAEIIKWQDNGAQARRDLLNNLSNLSKAMDEEINNKLEEVMIQGHGIQHVQLLRTYWEEIKAWDSEGSKQFHMFEDAATKKAANLSIQANTAARRMNMVISMLKEKGYAYRDILATYGIAAADDILHKDNINLNEIREAVGSLYDKLEPLRSRYENTTAMVHAFVDQVVGPVKVFSQVIEEGREDPGEFIRKELLAAAGLDPSQLNEEAARQKVAELALAWWRSIMMSYFLTHESLPAFDVDAFGVRAEKIAFKQDTLDVTFALVERQPIPDPDGRHKLVELRTGLVFEGAVSLRALNDMDTTLLKLSRGEKIDMQAFTAQIGEKLTPQLVNARAGLDDKKAWKSFLKRRGFPPWPNEDVQFSHGGFRFKIADKIFLFSLLSDTQKPEDVAWILSLKDRNFHGQLKKLIKEIALVLLEPYQEMFMQKINESVRQLGSEINDSSNTIDVRVRKGQIQATVYLKKLINVASEQSYVRLILTPGSDPVLEHHFDLQDAILALTKFPMFNIKKAVEQGENEVKLVLALVQDKREWTVFKDVVYNRKQNSLSFNGGPWDWDLPSGFSFSIKGGAEWKNGSLHFNTVTLEGPGPFGSLPIDSVILTPTSDGLNLDLDSRWENTIANNLTVNLKRLGLLQEDSRVVSLKFDNGQCRIQLLYGPIQEELELVFDKHWYQTILDAMEDQLVHAAETEGRDLFEQLLMGRMVDVPGWMCVPSSENSTLFSSCKFEQRFPFGCKPLKKIVATPSNGVIRFEAEINDLCLQAILNDFVGEYLPEGIIPTFDPKFDPDKYAVVVTVKLPVEGEQIKAEFSIGLDGTITNNLDSLRDALIEMAEEKVKKALAEKLKISGLGQQVEDFKESMQRQLSQIAESLGVKIEVKKWLPEGSIPKFVMFDISTDITGNDPIIYNARFSPMENRRLDLSEARLNEETMQAWIDSMMEGKDLVQLRLRGHQVSAYQIDLFLRANIDSSFLGKPVSTDLTAHFSDKKFSIDFENVVYSPIMDALAEQFHGQEFEIAGSVVRINAVNLVNEELVLKGDVDISSGLPKIPATVYIPMKDPGAMRFKCEADLDSLLSNQLGSLLGDIQIPLMQDTGLQVKNRRWLDENGNRTELSNGLPTGVGFDLGFSLMEGLNVEILDIAIDKDGPRWSGSASLIYTGTIAVSPFELSNIGGTLREKELTLTGDFSIVGASNIIKLRGRFIFKLDAPLHWMAEAELLAFTVFSLGESRTEIDIPKKFFSTEMHLGGVLSDIIEAKGHLVIDANKGIFGNADAALFGAKVANAKLVLDKEKRIFSVAGNVKLPVFKNESSFTTYEGFSNPELRVFEELRIGKFKLNKSEMAVNQNAARVGFSVFGMRFGVVMPSWRNLNEDILLDLLKKLFSVKLEDLDKALEAILSGNFTMNPWASFGPGDGGTIDSDGGEDGDGGDGPNGNGDGDNKSGEPGDMGEAMANNSPENTYEETATAHQGSPSHNSTSLIEQGTFVYALNQHPVDGLEAITYEQVGSEEKGKMRHALLEATTQGVTHFHGGNPPRPAGQFLTSGFGYYAQVLDQQANYGDKSGRGTLYIYTGLKPEEKEWARLPLIALDLNYATIKQLKPDQPLAKVVKSFISSTANRMRWKGDFPGENGSLGDVFRLSLGDMEAIFAVDLDQPLCRINYADASGSYYLGMHGGDILREIYPRDPALVKAVLEKAKVSSLECLAQFREIGGTFYLVLDKTLYAWRNNSFQFVRGDLECEKSIVEEAIPESEPNHMEDEFEKMKKDSLIAPVGGTVFVGDGDSITYKMDNDLVSIDTANRHIARTELNFEGKTFFSKEGPNLEQMFVYSYGTTFILVTEGNTGTCDGTLYFLTGDHLGWIELSPLKLCDTKTGLKEALQDRPGLAFALKRLLLETPAPEGDQNLVEYFESRTGEGGLEILLTRFLNKHSYKAFLGGNQIAATLNLRGLPSTLDEVTCDIVQHLIEKMIEEEALNALWTQLNDRVFAVIDDQLIVYRQRDDPQFEEDPWRKLGPLHLIGGEDTLLAELEKSTVNWDHFLEICSQKLKDEEDLLFEGAFLFKGNALTAVGVKWKGEKGWEGFLSDHVATGSGRDFGELDLLRDILFNACKQGAFSEVTNFENCEGLKGRHSKFLGDCSSQSSTPMKAFVDIYGEKLGCYLWYYAFWYTSTEIDDGLKDDGQTDISRKWIEIFQSLDLSSPSTVFSHRWSSGDLSQSFEDADGGEEFLGEFFNQILKRDLHGPFFSGPYRYLIQDELLYVWQNSRFKPLGPWPVSCQISQLAGQILYRTGQSLDRGVSPENLIRSMRLVNHPSKYQSVRVDFADAESQTYFLERESEPRLITAHNLSLLNEEDADESVVTLARSGAPDHFELLGKGSHGALIAHGNGLVWWSFVGESTEVSDLEVQDSLAFAALSAELVRRLDALGEAPPASEAANMIAQAAIFDEAKLLAAQFRDNKHFSLFDDNEKPLKIYGLGNFIENEELVKQLQVLARREGLDDFFVSPFPPSRLVLAKSVAPNNYQLWYLNASDPVNDSLGDLGSLNLPPGEPNLLDDPLWTQILAKASEQTAPKITSSKPLKVDDLRAALITLNNNRISQLLVAADDHSYGLEIAGSEHLLEVHLKDEMLSGVYPQVELFNSPCGLMLVANKNNRTNLWLSEASFREIAELQLQVNIGDWGSDSLFQRAIQAIDKEDLDKAGLLITHPKQMPGFALVQRPDAHASMVWAQGDQSGEHLLINSELIRGAPLDTLFPHLHGYDGRTLQFENVKDQLVLMRLSRSNTFDLLVPIAGPDTWQVWGEGLVFDAVLSTKIIETGIIAYQKNKEFPVFLDIQAPMSYTRLTAQAMRIANEDPGSYQVFTQLNGSFLQLIGKGWSLLTEENALDVIQNAKTAGVQHLEIDQIDEKRFVLAGSTDLRTLWALKASENLVVIGRVPRVPIPLFHLYQDLANKVDDGLGWATMNADAKNFSHNGKEMILTSFDQFEVYQDAPMTKVRVDGGNWITTDEGIETLRAALQWADGRKRISLWRSPNNRVFLMDGRRLGIYHNHTFRQIAATSSFLTSTMEQMLGWFDNRLKKNAGVSLDDLYSMRVGQGEALFARLQDEVIYHVFAPGSSQWRELQLLNNQNISTFNSWLPRILEDMKTQNLDKGTLFLRTVSAQDLVLLAAEGKWLLYEDNQNAAIIPIRGEPLLPQSLTTDGWAMIDHALAYQLSLDQKQPMDFLSRRNDPFKALLIGSTPTSLTPSTSKELGNQLDLSRCLMDREFTFSYLKLRDTNPKIFAHQVEIGGSMYRSISSATELFFWLPGRKQLALVQKSGRMFEITRFLNELNRNGNEPLRQVVQRAYELMEQGNNAQILSLEERGAVMIVGGSIISALPYSNKLEFWEQNAGNLQANLGSQECANGEPITNCILPIVNCLIDNNVPEEDCNLEFRVLYFFKGQ